MAPRSAHSQPFHEIIPQQLQILPVAAGMGLGALMGPTSFVLQLAPKKQFQSSPFSRQLAVNKVSVRSAWPDSLSPRGIILAIESKKKFPSELKGLSHQRMLGSGLFLLVIVLSGVLEGEKDAKDR